MKRLISIAAVLMFMTAAVPLFAVTRTVIVVDDVIKMTKAGVGDAEIIAFVTKSREDFDVNGDDVIAMTEANVSKPVIKAVIDEAAARRVDNREDRDGRRATSTRVYVSPRVISPYYYDPFWYGAYDPFWYGPRVSLNFGFGGGFRGHYRGGYRGHNGGHRGHR